MTTYDQLKSLQAKLSKEVTDLKKKRDAAKTAVEKALAEFQKLDAKVKEMEGLLGTSTPAPKAAAPVIKKAATPVVQAAPAGVRLKKDGTPKKKPGPAKAAAPKAAAKAAPKAAKAAAPKVAAKAAPAGVRLKKDGTPKKKPGPAPKTVKAAAPKAAKAPKAPKAAAPKAAPAPKAEPKKTPKQKNRAAEGRRAVLAGERPTLKDSMKQVMGKTTMNSQEVYDALKAKGWLPNSNDPKSYIGYSLSSMKDHFERVADKGRGFYRVKGVTGTTARNGEATPSSVSSASEPDTSLADAAAILGIN